MQQSGPVSLKLAIALAAVAAILFAPQSAFAASKLCRQLEAQLASVGSGGGNSTQVRRYERAIRDQRNELRQARRQARRIGCSAGGFVLFGRGAFNDRCDPLNTTIKKMEFNLAKLESRIDDMRGASVDRRRQSILARIEANRCRTSDEHVRRLPDPIETTARRDYNLMDRLFGGRFRSNGFDDRPGYLLPGDDGGLQRMGSFRTLCVRTCDGYYFPISYSATSDQIGRDEQACRQMCPGVEVKLYTHRVPDEEPEDMISMTGEPYTELPTAFAYRDPGFTTPPGCACHPAKDYAVIAGESDEEKDTADEAGPYIPAPRPRPDPGLDPESAQNAAGGLTVAKIRLLLKPKPTAEDVPKKRNIRVVGPAFLPDPSEAIDLKSRDRSAVQ